MNRLVVQRPGMFTTVQDRGRHGVAHLGVPASGPMDRWSARLANRLVGNPDGAAVLEVTLLGPRLRLERPATLAVTGAPFALDLDGRAMRSPLVIQGNAGTVVTFKERQSGARAYVAVDGGFQLPSVLGSLSAQTRSPFPGLAGRALRANDAIALHPRRAGGRAHVGAGAFDWWTASRPDGSCTLRVIPAAPAPAEGAAEALCATRFIVSARSDRMGYRLEGSVGWPELPGSLLSAATAFGAIQVPPGGEPILLMADHQTTGGYAQVAVVCRADRQVAGQLAPGDAVRFRAVSLEEARAAHAAREALLDDLAPEVRP